MPANGPASEIKLAIFDPKLPKLAKKIRRLMGLLKEEEKRKVAMTKRIPTIEILELTRSVISKALSWPAEIKVDMM